MGDRPGSDKHGIVRLTRVAHVRGLRLARAIEDARRAHDAAIEAHQAATDQLHFQHAILGEARAMFAGNPACGQSKLWLDCNARRTDRCNDAVVEATVAIERAVIVRTEAAQAATRHQTRSDRIADHHRALLRTDRLQAEIVAERDAPPSARRAVP